jgi:uracil-DNA glycosylase
MRDDHRTALASFITQRMELGETEWCIGPAGRAGFESFVDDSPAAQASSTGGTPDVSPRQQEPLQATETSSACDKEQFTTQDLAATDTLDTLKETVCGCMRCALGGTRKNFVFGEGDPGAGIMFVGEAPGAEEDTQGRPFVGRAGKLLTQMIEAMKLSRGDVYIGNILKCRPPNNRDPKPGEIAACEPILLRQIELIKPKVICALGRISGQTLLRSTGTLGSLRGTIHDYHGVKLIVTYHPAALLRNSNWKPAAWEDLKLVRRIFDGLEL